MKWSIHWYPGMLSVGDNMSFSIYVCAAIESSYLLEDKFEINVYIYKEYKGLFSIYLKMSVKIKM